jgi:hypothetical protein
MAIIKKTLLVIILLITVFMSQSCEKDPLDTYEEKIEYMLEMIETYGYTLNIIQTYEGIITAEKEIEVRIDNIKNMMYVYVYETVLGSFNQENTIFEITYFYESQMIYEDLGDVMISRPGDKDELISMTSLLIFKDMFRKVKNYEIHSEGIRLHLNDSYEIDIEIKDSIITKVEFSKVLTLTTITHTFYPFYENGEVFIPKYKLEGTPA